MACEPYAIAATREDCSRSLSRECSRRGDRVIRISSNSTKRPPDAFVETRATISDDAPRRLMKKMTQATDLIGGLSGEQKRWTEDANGFASEKLRLVGDCAVACAFVSYCGPFNQEYRSYCIVDKYSNECETRHVPVTQNLNIIEFLADIGTIGDWNQVRDAA